MDKRIVVATSNRGKLREITELLSPGGWNIVPQSDFEFDDAEETGSTFVDNAIIKARNACAHCGLAAIADDSGLEVDALQGKPGVYSARYAGADATDQDNVDKLLHELHGVAPDKRTARFRCVMVYLQQQHDPSPIICEGTWEGSIAEQPSGHNGFGYDPVFIVDQQGHTAAQLEPAQKNRLSHRGQALRQLERHLL